ncbi:hypothetical protein HanXRQr2_Chr17g0830161 [Helianthus annuus]|uniref:Uncharacterized protein n=1 Tax=Helianthus annuus TaxID=4232 RepID=A0A251RUP0_HELAN|nr:hypothetical protein HanXRQr2_Chr17g0830161 [Helianthus annuus]
MSCRACREEMVHGSSLLITENAEVRVHRNVPFDQRTFSRSGRKRKRLFGVWLLLRA